MTEYRESGYNQEKTLGRSFVFERRHVNGQVTSVVCARDFHIWRLCDADTSAMRLGLKLSPAALPPISLQQHLTVQRNGTIDEPDVVLEVNAQRLDLVGLALGRSGCSTLSYDGQILNTWRHPMFPAVVRSEDILEDIQLILWPVHAVRQAYREIGASKRMVAAAFC